MKLTDKQREALEALSDVMREHDIYLEMPIDHCDSSIGGFDFSWPYTEMDANLIDRFLEQDKS